MEQSSCGTLIQMLSWVSWFLRRVGLSRQYNLTGSDLKAIEKKLLRYQKIDSVIQYRNYELEMKITDSYIGGKRANKVSKPTEDIIRSGMQIESYKISMNSKDVYPRLKKSAQMMKN